MVAFCITHDFFRKTLQQSKILKLAVQKSKTNLMKDSKKIYRILQAQYICTSCCAAPVQCCHSVKCGQSSASGNVSVCMYASKEILTHGECKQDSGRGSFLILLSLTTLSCKLKIDFWRMVCTGQLLNCLEVK